MHQANLYNLVPPPPGPHQHAQQMPPANHHGSVVGSSPGQLTKSQQRMLGESDADRAKRLAKNAERMRQKRAAAAAAAATAGQNYAAGPHPPPPPLQQQPQQQLQQQPVLYNLVGPGQMPQLQQVQAPPAAQQTTQQVPAGPTGTPKGYLRGETEEARQKRLAKNAERMRQKRSLEKQAAVAQPVTTAAPIALLPANPTYVTLQPNVYLTLTQTPAPAPVAPPAPVDPSLLTKAQRRMLGESSEARIKRLTKNAERMRQKRANQTYEEYRAMLARNAERMRQKRNTRTFEEYKIALAKNAESNRRRRANETPEERALRHMRNAMRQRLRRAMETPEQKAIRKARLAQRMREIRSNESYEQRQVRLAKGAARARQRFLNETPEERAERNRRKAEYARLCRSPDPRKKQQIQNQPPSQLMADIKAEHQQASSSSTTVQPSLETPIPGYPINYSEFGAAFPSFLNYPMKNGQQTSAGPAFNPTSYPTTTTMAAGQPPYYPELTVPTPVMAAGAIKSEKPKSGGDGEVKFSVGPGLI
ncbi:conserved hypothetical protein [Culex quinquefasciatus]|uniref:STPR domain-containing protein n=1 Tax=Culex quinquefasciatus TaxID=7176 RepID=B0WCX0_CULQU|nr:conserved hypothetical protein [Culex quinquefasciatus]|eukprot:XP_001846554.1 conserved hypothetical protein [Culex quinquefasciatus]